MLLGSREAPLDVGAGRGAIRMGDSWKVVKGKGRGLNPFSAPVFPPAIDYKLPVCQEFLIHGPQLVKSKP